MVDGDSNVVPEYSHRTGSVDRHGTSCAGVIAMARDNDYCGVGVAYNARLVGKLSLSFLFYSLDLSLLSPSLSLSLSSHMQVSVSSPLRARRMQWRPLPWGIPRRKSISTAIAGDLQITVLW